MNATENRELVELEQVVEQARSVTVRDDEKAVIIETLKPISELIPGYRTLADRLVIGNAAQANDAAAVLTEIKAHRGAAVGVLTARIDLLHKTHRAWTTFRAMFTDPLDQAEKAIRSKIVAWQVREQEKAAAEQRRLQAEADEKARREQEKLLARADSLKTPEKAEALREQAATVTAPVVHVESPKAIGTRKVWTVAEIDMAKFLAAAVMDESLQGYITVATNAMVRAKAANKMLAIPGVKFLEVTK